METLSTVMPIILCMLTSILVVILIILAIKLIYTVDKVNAIADDVAKKVNSLNGFFSIVDLVTDKVAFLSDKVVDLVTSFFTKIFNNKNKNIKGKDENHE